MISKCRNSSSSPSVASIHGAVLALAASVLSAPYDMPRFALFNTKDIVFRWLSLFYNHLSNFFSCFCSWLPEHVTLLARFVGEASPVKSTVTKAVAEFRRTHADTWNIQKDSFTEEQLEVVS